jgi:hypothetical protein
VLLFLYASPLPLIRGPCSQGTGLWLWSLSFVALARSYIDACTFGCREKNISGEFGQVAIAKYKNFIPKFRFEIPGCLFQNIRFRARRKNQISFVLIR